MPVYRKTIITESVHFSKKTWKFFTVFPSLCSSFFFILSFTVFTVFSQEPPIISPLGEELHNLESNPLLFKKTKNSPSDQLKNNHNLIYRSDTLKLPFIDDFSSDRTKKRGNGVDTLFKVFFTVDGNYTDSIEGVKFPTYMYYYNLATQQYDSNSTGQIIILYENLNPALENFTYPTDTDTLWKSTTYRFNEFSIDTYNYSPDTTYLNYRDTFYIVEPDSISIWLDSSAFINNGFGFNPPTLGVATFDGLDFNGVAYDFSVPNSYGPADFLTSKPIDLSSLTSDSSVILSFYFQPQGMGDFPDPGDSLALEFYSPEDSLWNWIWSTPGLSASQSQPVFQLIKTSISEEKFLKKGFQFRFRNYATLSGMLDIWNIDYVYLDKNRDPNENQVNDLAFLSRGNSLVNIFTSMPIKAFKESASLFMVPGFPATLANLSNNTVFNDSNRYFIYNENETTLYKASSNLQFTFAPLSQQSINQPIFSSPNNFLFTPVDTDRVVFKFKLIAGQTGPDINRYNDTVVHYQVFDSYYSYDDGSAEGIYALAIGNKAEVNLACKFSTVIQDTLRGVYFYFPYMLNDASQLNFKIFVWSDNNGVPGNIIYQDNDIANPDYSQMLNEFVRYEINPPVPINGTYYIGWQQTQASGGKIYLGFDKTINNQSKIFHTLAADNSWANTSLTGSLMIRPDFGLAEPVAGVNRINPEGIGFNFFPNPASDLISINFLSHNLEKNTKAWRIKIFTLQGSEVLSWRISKINSQIDITSLPNGIYFVKAESENAEISEIKKLIIAR